MSNKINYTSLFSILFLASCSDNEISNQLIEYTSEVEELVQHSDEFIPKVYSYENGIHIAIGYGIANSIMVEGEGPRGAPRGPGLPAPAAAGVPQWGGGGRGG